MASLFQKKDRHLIPNWRSFENTAILGELNGSKGIKLDSSFRPDITDLIDDWEQSQTIGVAGDILGVALVCNQEDNPTVQLIAQFVLNNSNISSKAILNAAKAVLKPKSDTIELYQDIRPATFQEINYTEIYIKINSLKKKLISNSANPISWIELARYYSMLGQNNKARRSILNAIYLSPENRFVVRSAVRFFVHTGDFEFAHDLIRKTNLVKYDPWIMATEIAVASLRNRYSRFIKHGQQIINSASFHPFNITELASSLASVEFENSRLKQSRILFQKSLTNPNDNSLAQAEWASQKDKSVILVQQEQFNLINSFEATAREYSEREMWDNAIDFSKKWFFDLPFSKMPILFGVEIAAAKMKNHELAVDIGKLGLISHPNDGQLLNNIIYSLSVSNQIELAGQYIQQLKREDLNDTDLIGIYLTATRGLYQYRKGLYEKGRELYLDAIKMARQKKNEYLISLALVNFVREEMRIGNNDISDIIPKLHQISEKWPNETVSTEALELIEQFNHIKSTITLNPLHISTSLET